MNIKEGIPKILHKIWLGGPLPAQEQEWLRSWENLMPDWEVRVWDDRTILDLDAPRSSHWKIAGTQSEKSDLLRFEILHRFGGIYSDTDVQCLRSFDPLLIEGVTCFLGWERPGRVCGAVMGATPGHSFMQNLLENAGPSFSLHKDPTARAGPRFLTKHLKQYESSVTVFPEHYFYPYWFDDRNKYPIHLDFRALFPESYAVHHWMFSWGKRRCL